MTNLRTAIHYSHFSGELVTSQAHGI